MEDEEVKEDPGPPGWPWHDRPGHQICDFLQNSAEFPDPLSPGEGSPLLWEAPPQDPHGIVQNSMEFSDLLPQEKGPPFSGAADSGFWRKFRTIPSNSQIGCQNQRGYPLGVGIHQIPMEFQWDSIGIHRVP